MRRLHSLKATPMEDAFLKKMKTSLVALKKEILKNLASENEDFRIQNCHAMTDFLAVAHEDRVVRAGVAVNSNPVE